MSYCTDDIPEIHAGEPFVEKKSKFQAFCAECHSVQDVCIFRDTLLDNPKIEEATHNILAYIVPQEEGYDDDGESHAGIQVLQIMQLAGAKNCAVMVSRWYGGIQLHGDRFRIINRLALDCLRKYGLIKNEEEEENEESSDKKKGKKNKANKKKK